MNFSFSKQYKQWECNTFSMVQEIFTAKIACESSVLILEEDICNIFIISVPFFNIFSINCYY